MGRRAVSWLCAAVLMLGSSVAWGQVDEALVENRVALFPVHYGADNGEPLVGAKLPDISSGLKRIWSGEVLADEALADAMRGTFVTQIDQAALSKLDAEVKKGEGRFHQESPEKAIPVLERVVSGADSMLAHVSADSKRAQMLLKAHLLLWWALSSVGEKDRLQSLMAQTVERFPAAVVDTTLMPPHVAEAFVQARETHDQTSVTVTLALESAPEGKCRIEVNGSRIGDGRNGAFGAKPGRSYYVVGRCDEAVLPPRRVVAQAPTTVRLDMSLTRALRRTSAGETLLLPEGPEQLADMTRVSQAIGRVLGAGQVLLVGVFSNPEGGLVMQFDKLDVATGVRTCSVRLEGAEGVGRADIDQALRAIRESKPTTHRKITFAEESGKYLTPDEYVEQKLEEQDSGRLYTWITGGVALGVLATAGAFEFVAFTAQLDLDDCVASLNCRGTGETESLRNELNDTLVVRDVLYITSGLLVAGAVALYFLEQPNASDYLADGEASVAPTDGWRVLPWVGVDGGGVGVEITLD